MSTAFFCGPKEHFFRPLTWQNRECYAAVLRSVFERVHGAHADYSEVLTRERVIAMILHVFSDPGYRAHVFDPGEVISEEKERAAAAQMLLELKAHGWLEDNKDPIDLKPTLKLTRAGKEFAEVFSNLDNSRTKTRQRNMRSAKKSLDAFLQSLDADELLDGYDYATRVVQDLQDDIEYFRMLLQSLTREALEQKVAWEEFNEFVERRFAREYSVRLVADSAERHRGNILEMLDLIRSFDAAKRANVDGTLKQRAPWIESEVQGRSPMLWLCERIEGMVEAACSLKLPMLRVEMGNYVKRFTSLLRQALSLDYSAASPLGRTMSWLKARRGDHRRALLDALAQRLAPSEVGLTGSSVRWPTRGKVVDPAEQGPILVDEASRLEAAMRRAEAEAFAFSELEILEVLRRHMDTHAIRLSELPADSATDVLVSLHAVGAARSTEGRTKVLARKLGQSFETDYFIATDYELQPQESIES
jgi:hypothetical protein